MKNVLVLLAVLTMAATVFAAPGDIIGSTFNFGVVRGLDKDWADGNIWMTTAVSNACQIGKFDAVTHAQVGSWVTAAGQYWCFDCGYGYVYNGNPAIILIDQNAPNLRMYDPLTGTHLVDLPAAFSSGYHEGIGVQAGPLAPTGNNLFATDYSFNYIQKSDYPATTWTNFATIPATPPMGCCYAWGKVIVVTTSADYKLYEFNGTTGALENTWPLTGWSSYMVGISAGRADAVGLDESIFITCFSGAATGISEIEIGDIYTPNTRVEPTSLGMIKGLYK